MKTSNYFSGNIKQKFEKFFDKTLLSELGKTSGFIQRDSKKIKAFAFIAGFVDCCIKGCNTFSTWAAAIGFITYKKVSKQALQKRMTAKAVAFCKAAFQEAMSAKLKPLIASRLFSSFGRVLLQDSTTLSLPQCLSEHFPGNRTHTNGLQKAVARLQCLLNLSTLQWLSVELKAFTDNDQGASADALPFLQKGDLLIRDLGYFVLDIFNKIIDCQAFFISRLRYDVCLFDKKGEKVNWKELLNKEGITDKIVWMGEQQKIRVRIVLVPLPATVAAERVRKAKADRDKRLNHSPDYYQWLSYSVFVSNVEEETLSGKDIAAAYRLRWQIELIFKNWKSNCGLQQLLHQGCTNEQRVRASIYMLLMLCCLIVQKVYVAYYSYIKRAYGRALSLMKLTRFAMQNLTVIIVGRRCEIKEQLVTHCCYESRNNRVNMIEFLHYF